LPAAANTGEGHEMTNDDLHDLTAAYALDALDEEERRAYEVHLGECAQCRAELASMSVTVGALAYATEGPVPSTELRDRIVEAARAEPPKVVPLRPRRTRLYTGIAIAAAACAALAIGLSLALSGGGGGKKLALTVQPTGTAQLAVSGFDAAPAGKIYEVWVIANGKPVPAAVFAGGGRTVVVLERPVPKGATVAVTLEQAPRAQTPTLPILAQTTAV
jgi:anti-sigma factor RsiW